MLPVLFGVALGAGAAFGQHSGGEKESLVIQRTSITNFIDDPIVLGNRPGDVSVKEVLSSVFILSSPATGQQICWDPGSCRLLAVKAGAGESPAFREIVAQGAHPFNISMGALGRPRFFGFRVVDGVPQFLYTYGQLSIEEKLELSADGKQLFQSFTVTANAMSGSIRFPESWREIASANAGEWSNNVLHVPKDALANGFTVTYQLDPEVAGTTISQGDVD